MKKAPKGIKRKKYVDGTPSAGVQEPDDNTQKDTRNLGSKIGGSMGWLTYANMAQGAVRQGNDAKNANTIVDPVTGQTYTDYKNSKGRLTENFAKPLHEKVLGDIKQGDYSGALKQTLTGGLLLDKSKQDEFEKNRQRINGELGQQSALNARDNGVTNFTSTETYHKPVQEKNRFLDKFANVASFAKGGEIKGKGTGTSDSINAEVESGSFIVPAKNAEMGERIKKAVTGKKTGKADLHQKKNAVPVKLSNGEICFTPEEKDAITEEMGEGILKMLAPDAKEESDEKKDGGELSAEKAKKILHEGVANGEKLTDRQRRFMGWVAGGRKMATGGAVEDFGVTDESNDGYKKGGEVKGYAKGTTEEGVTDPNKITSKTPPTQKKVVTKSKSVPANKFRERDYMSSITPKYGLANTETADDLKGIDNVKTNAIDTNPIQTKPSETKQKSNFWDKVSGINTDGALTGALNYGLSAYQIGKGLQGLKNSGTRPTYKIDPAFQKQLDQSLVNESFGFTPEQKFALDQQNQNALNAGRFAARNYSGGSGGNAFNMERNAINDAYTRSLENASADTQLKQGKRQEATNLLLNKADMNRQIFQDSMNAFQQKQASNAQLLQTGISNALDSNRYANFMRLRNQENDFQNQYGI